MIFKDEIVARRFDLLCPMIKKIAIEMDQWTQENYNIELTLTATVSTGLEDKELNRISDTHRTRRAVDIRVSDLPDSLIAELCAEFRKRYNKYGAASGGDKNLIVYRPHGSGPHLHVQVNRTYALPPID
jgi:hypothetical protein